MKLIAAVSALTLSMGLANAAQTTYNFDGATTGAVVGGGAATTSVIPQAGGPVPASDAPFSGALTALGITSASLSATSLSSNFCGVNPVPCHQGGVVNTGAPNNNMFDTGWGGQWTLNVGGSGISSLSFLYVETESTSGGTDGFRVDLYDLAGTTLINSHLFGQSAANGTSTGTLTATGNVAIGKVVIVDLGSGSFSSTGDGVRLDNLTTDTIISGGGVPEPSTYLMVGSALAGLAAFRRRRA